MQQDGDLPALFNDSKSGSAIATRGTASATHRSALTTVSRMFTNMELKGRKKNMKRPRTTIKVRSRATCVLDA